MTGFASPNHTQTPNELFDLYMPEMGECELKVTLAVIRQTLGYHKKKDPISISRLQKLTGLSRPGVIEGTDKALQRGLIEIVGTGSRGVNIFGLVINFNQSDDDQSEFLTRTSKNFEPTKETNKRNKNTVASDEAGDSSNAKSKKTREPNPMYDAIKDIWGYTASMNGAMAKMLTGIATQKGWKEYNLETPITPDGLRLWAKWYRQTALKGDDSLNMLEERIKIQSSITQWQETHQTVGEDGEVRTASYVIGSDDDPFKDEIVD